MQQDLTAESPYIVGSYAPIAKETESDRCVVIAGEIPRDFSGTYVRNGPNPQFAPKGRYHWFDGDGMLHALHFSNGNVSYRNRWVHTAGFERERSEGTAVWSGLMESLKNNPREQPLKDTANTDVVFHGGVLKALWYLCGRPYKVALDTLETLGVDDFGGTYSGPVSAHAKVDPRTGELLFFEYGPRPPFLRYGVASADGKLAHLVSIPLPGPRFPHDMAFTENYALLMDLPIVFDQESLARGRWKTDFRKDLPSRFAILPRRGDEASVRWFEAEPCYIYHTINSWEQGDEVVLLGCRVANPIPEVDPAEGPYAQMMANLRLHAELYRWTFDLRTGKTKEEKLDDRNTEFPTIDRRLHGVRSKRSYNVVMGETRTAYFTGLTAYNTDTGAGEVYMYPDGVYGSEPGFAPRNNSTGEDNGYVVTIVHDEREQRSECQLFDAASITKGPIARIALPQRVPLGFHALWVPQ